MTAARAAGRIGSSVPEGAPQHIDEIRAVLWWAIKFTGGTGKLRSTDEIRAELAAAQSVPRLTPKTKERGRVMDNTLRWLLGETDDLYGR
ncbi:hypothetical protein [Microbacterium gorillae]|uniref:hypothetical protein n=1 Tax=Microbacterium gorillae TaxID=1231063 RepID=UPI003D981857